MLYFLAVSMTYLSLTDFTIILYGTKNRISNVIDNEMLG